VAETLATAWVQLVPSFDQFEKELVKELDKASAGLRAAGEKAGKQYAQAFASALKGISIEADLGGAQAGAAGLASGIKEAAAKGGAEGGVAAREELVKTMKAETVGEEAGVGFAQGFIFSASAIFGGAVGGVGATILGTLTKIAAGFQDVNRTIVVGTGASGTALTQLQDDARAVGRTTASSFNDVATAVADINTRLGLSGEPLQKLTTQFTDLSRLTGTDVAGNVASVARVFNDWSIATGRQSQALDELFVVSQNTGIGVEQLARTATQSGTTFRELGFSFKETIATIGQFEKEGVNVELVLSGLRRSLPRLANDTRGTAVAFREQLIAIRDAGSAAEANSIAFELFQSRAGIDMARAIREGRFEIDELVNTLTTADGAISRTADAAQTTGERLSIAMNRLTTAIEPATEATISFFEGSIGAFETVLSAVEELAPSFGKTAGVLAAFTGGVAALAGVASLGTIAIMRLQLTVEAYRAAAGSATASTVALSAALKLLKGAGAVAAAGVALLAYDAAIAGARDLTGAADKTEKAFNTTNVAVRESSLTIQQFKASVIETANSLGALERLGDALREGLFGGGSRKVDEFKTSIINVRREIDRVAKSEGIEGLREIRKVLADAREEAGDGTQAWKDYTEAITRVDQAMLRTGQIQPFPSAFDFLFGGLADEAKLAERATQDLNAVLEDMTRQADLAAASTNFNAAAADNYARAARSASGAAAVLASALSVGAAFRTARQGFGFELSSDQRNKLADAADKTSKAKNKAAKATDILAEAMRRFDPQAASATVRLNALDAAARAFGDSIRSSSSLPGQVGAGLTLGNAFDDFRKTFRRLPAEIDLVSLSLGKYRPRQREAIQNVLQLGEGTRSYLEQLIASGKSSSQVRSEADRLRAAYIAQLKALGLTESQLSSYLELLGLTPQQVETALRVSGLESARFRVQTYLNLLTNRIPRNLETQIIALIEKGDLDAAATTLANWAATNPAERIDVPVGVDGKSLEGVSSAVAKTVQKIERELNQFPAELNIGKALLGQYTEAEQRGLETLINLSSTANQFIGELIAAGQGGAAKTWADQINAGAREMLERLNAPKGKIDELLEGLGFLDGTQVEALVKVSLQGAALPEIATLLELLNAPGGAGLPSKLNIELQARLAQGDPQGAAELLRWFAGRTAQGASVEQVLAELDLIPTPAEEALQAFRDRTLSDPAEIKAYLNSGPADKENIALRSRLERLPAPIRARVDDSQARGTIDDFDRNYIQPLRVSPFDLDDTPARNRIARLATELADSFNRLSLLATLSAPPAPTPAPSTRDRRRRGRANGGFIAGAGGPVSDSIPAYLSNGEYVLRSAAVRGIGTDLLDRINRTGVVPRFADGGTVGAVSPAMAVSGPSIEYTVVEAKSKPRPEDVVRAVGRADFLGKF
jgi:TP901 family phage tail tape measure protein